MSETDSSGAAPAPQRAEEADLFVPVYPFPRLELLWGRGASVKASDGRIYLDFVSGIAVNAFGHAPPGLARTVSRQMKMLVHTSNVFGNAPARELARVLTAATGYDRVFFSNSGTEGIEAALKFSRARARALGRTGGDIVAFKGGFHGRTGFALSVTWKPAYREPFLPLVPGIRFGEFNHVAGLDTLIDTDVAAVIVEPIQGEAGAVPATRAFLEALREQTRRVGALLILDEIQSGVGRCGRILAAQEFGVQADITVLAKALGAGVPIGAVLVGAEVAALLKPGQHGTTFGGGPVATAAGLWVLSRVTRPGFLARVRRRGRELADGLDALVARHSSLAQARGLGLLRAVELAPDAPFDPPAVMKAARARGLLVVRGGDRAVRLLPPLTVSTKEIGEALERLDAAFHDLEGGTPPP